MGESIARPLAEGATLIVGRDSSVAGWTLADPRISGRHAELRVVGGVLTVTDLGSTAGTYVGGARIAAPTVVPRGGEVRFGPLAFRLEG